MTNKTGNQIDLKLIRSTICCPPWMRVIVQTLGLKKMHKVKRVTDNPAIRGMVKKVSHLVQLTEV